MSAHDETSWTLIRGAADGRATDRDAFARRYEQVIRAYLAARWNRGPLAPDIDDAVQNAFIECLRPGGALGRADPEKPGRFRTFLFAVVRNVARRHEERWARHARRREAAGLDLSERDADVERASEAFDRAWSGTLLRQAADVQRTRALEAGERALRRVELLRLRFHEDLPIREIAVRWNAEPARVHREYARARNEFEQALREVLAEHVGTDAATLDRECLALLESLA